MAYQSQEVDKKQAKSVKFSDNETLNGELNEKEIELVQGGVALNPEQVAEVVKLAKESGKDHGVNAPALIASYAVGTIADFGGNAAGNLAGSQVHKKN